MLLTPGPINACYLTDQRGFSSDINAHARMHSEIEIDMQAGVILHQLHRCDETIEVDCDNGKEKCRQSAETGQMKFSGLKVSQEGAITLEISGSTHNPCLKVANIAVSPNLDYNGTISIVPLRDGVSVAFKGNIETYPAFEMYAA
ncbi:MAG: hypothetical protein K8I30_09700, partial [Anaerolineae bacterium]|nr:hypothetical protein [Anaerolineae bacterium]